MSDQLSTDSGTPTQQPEETRVMRGIRLGLIGLGVALLAWGAYVMLDTVRVNRLPGVALWIIAAIILHDAILAPIVFLIGVLLRRGGQRVGGTVVVVIQGFIVVGSIVSLIVVPVIVALSYTGANPTVLPLDYGLNLAVFWLVLTVLAAGLAVLLYSRTKRANERSDTLHS